MSRFELFTPAPDQRSTALRAVLASKVGVDKVRIDDRLVNFHAARARNGAADVLLVLSGSDEQLVTKHAEPRGVHSGTDKGHPTTSSYSPWLGAVLRSR